jgi:hypothetical protein
VQGCKDKNIFDIPGLFRFAVRTALVSQEF